MSYVLDASAGVELLLGTATGAALEPKLPAGVVWVPEIYYAEVAGALRRLELASLRRRAPRRHSMTSFPPRFVEHR